jgi:hypothetical protein
MASIPDGGGESTVVDLMERMADLENCTIDELPSLYRTIAPELIEAIPPRATLTFPYCGYEVAVDGSGSIVIGGFQAT